MDTLGQRLKQTRERRLLTQQDVATTADVPVITISRLENEHSTGPRPSTIRKLAAALDVDPAWLMFGDDQGQTTTPDQD